MMEAGKLSVQKYGLAESTASKRAKNKKKTLFHDSKIIIFLIEYQ